jgi:hypothetical protein
MDIFYPIWIIEKRACQETSVGIAGSAINRHLKMPKLGCSATAPPRARLPAVVVGDTTMRLFFSCY